MSPERRRITYALLLSLLIHTLLLSLTFRGQGNWLLWLAFPWQDRRIEAPDLRVTLVPAPLTAAEPAVTPVAEPAQQATVEQQPVTSGPALTPPVSRAPTTVRLAIAAGSEADSKAEATPKTTAAPRAATARPRSRADRSRNTAPPPSPAPAVIALERIDEDTWVVPATPVMQMPTIAAAPSASIPETEIPSLPDVGDAAGAQIDQEAPKGAIASGKPDRSKQEEQRQAEQLETARKEAAREEATRAENARLEIEREAAARIEAARRDAQRQEAARLAAAHEAQRQETARREEAARIESARQEAQRQEATRVAAAQEAQRQEAARREAQRQEAARLAAAQEAQRQEVARREEAARVEAERREAERQEAARLAAAQEAQRQEAARREEAARIEAARREAERQEVARNEAARRETERQEAARVEAREAEARREEKLRAIGRQLDEEAAQRQAATVSTSASRALPPPWNLRRYKLLGRTDPNHEIILYAEAFGRKIQMNMTFDMVREAVKQPHNDPVVTVAIRSDGSVESVTFFQSSGVPALDEAIRRVVDSQKPYQAFPPRLASQYDVLEIRRTWYFEKAIRLY